MDVADVERDCEWDGEMLSAGSLLSEQDSEIDVCLLRSDGFSVAQPLGHACRDRPHIMGKNVLECNLRKFIKLFLDGKGWKPSLNLGEFVVGVSSFSGFLGELEAVLAAWPTGLPSEADREVSSTVLKMPSSDSIHIAGPS